MCHCRLFHLVIQLFSHLVDVPASNPGARARTQNRKDGSMRASERRGAADWKDGRLQQVQCASVLVFLVPLSEDLATFRRLKAVSIWLKVQLCTNRGQKAFQPNSVCFILSNSSRKDLFKTASTVLEDKDTLPVFCLIFLSLVSHLSWKICGPNTIKRH